MYVECPEFQRCCFCIPMRYGLLVWAYLKTTLTLLLLIFWIGQTIHVYPSMSGLMLARHTFEILMTALNLSSSLLLVIAAHKKSTHLLRIFYLYDLGLAISNFLKLIADIIYFIVLLVNNIFFIIIIHYVFVFFMLYLINVVMQCYILLIVRSKREKMLNNENFKFVNNAAEGECTYFGQHNDSEIDRRATSGDNPVTDDDKLVTNDTTANDNDRINTNDMIVDSGERLATNDHVVVVKDDKSVKTDKMRAFSDRLISNNNSQTDLGDNSVTSSLISAPVVAVDVEHYDSSDEDVENRSKAKTSYLDKLAKPGNYDRI